MSSLSCHSSASAATEAGYLTLYVMVSGKPISAFLPPPPVFSWTGLYVGGNVGYAWGHFGETDLDDYNMPGESFGGHPSGVLGGGQIGYNWQVANFVFGVEASVGYMDLHRTTPQPRSPIDTFFAD